MDFSQSISCSSRVHCHTCRNLFGGRQWRRSLGQHFDLHDGLIDFPCPINKPWIGEGEPTDEKQVKLAAAKPIDPAVIEQDRIEHEAKEAAALPSAWERVVKGSIGLAKVALGVDRSPDALIESRKVVCEACPHLKANRCELCGCLYRKKIALASETCPDHPPRW